MEGRKRQQQLLTMGSRNRCIASRQVRITHPVSKIAGYATDCIQLDRLSVSVRNLSVTWLRH